MENYEQKYKDAFERAKECHIDGLALHQPVKAVIEHIFPELKESEDEKVRKQILDCFKTMKQQGCFPSKHKEQYDSWITWLEKQGEQEQLYIRFGEIPSDEKSKIYRGEIEVGTENGVSVYPAFRTNEGDIILGLNLPITKTTLYTQQHLLEYDNRPCYLVKGDYVGKDSDGQPLINNISIIEKIDSYRVKKGEPKFKVGDWVVRNYTNHYKTVNKVVNVKLLDAGTYGYKLDDSTYFSGSFEKDYHLWTIEDAEKGDVLCYKDDIFLLDYYFLFNKVGCQCCYIDSRKRFIPHNIYSFTRADFNKIHPATKEQRDLLFQKMKELGYKWDSNKKELIV